MRCLCQKGIVDVQLAKRPSRRKCQAKDEVYHSKLDNRTKSLEKVNAHVLMNPLGNKANFKAINKAIKNLLEVKTHLQLTRL